MHKNPASTYAVLILVLTTLSNSPVIAQFEGLDNPDYVRKVKAAGKIYDEQLIYEQNDSSRIIDITSALRNYGINSGDEQTAIEAEYIELNYLIKNTYVPASKLLPRLNKLIDDAIDHSDLKTHVKTRLLLADYYWFIKEYEQAFEEYLAVNDMAARLSEDGRNLKATAAYQTGKINFYFKEYEIAKKYFTRGNNYNSGDMKVASPGNEASLNFLGLAWQKTGNLDSSDHYFTKLKNFVRDPKDSTWVGIGTGYLGYNQYLRGNYELAEKSLMRGISIARYYKDIGWEIRQKLWLADVYLKMNRLTEVKELINYTRNNLSKNTSQAADELNMLLYPLMSKTYASDGNVLLAGRYLDSTISVSSRLDKEFSGLLVARVQQKISRTEQKRIQDERNSKIRERNILIGFVLILLIVSIYTYRLQQKKHQQQQLFQEAELRQQQMELESSRGQLKDFTKMIADKNSLIELLENQPGSESIDEALSELQQSNILTNYDWEKFKNLFEKVHSGYLQNLQVKLPGLSPTETRYMALAKLNFSNKEMAYALGVSPESIRVTLHRLRKKLDLSDDTSMEDFINSI